MGIGCFQGNGFIDRCFLPFIAASKRPASQYSHLDALLCTRRGRLEVRLYTGLQLLFAIAIFGITKTPLGIAFPLLIAGLVFVRHKVLPNVFT